MHASQSPEGRKLITLLEFAIDTICLDKPHEKKSETAHDVEWRQETEEASPPRHVVVERVSGTRDVCAPETRDLMGTRWCQPRAALIFS